MTVPIVTKARNCAGRATPLKTLLFDDDPDSRSLIADFLRDHDVSVHPARDGITRITGRITDNYDLILIDVVSPPKNGFDLLRAIRTVSDVPVILLTAQAGPQDHIEGLNRGADDCLAKSFGPQELIARIRAVVRRTVRGIDRDLLCVGDIVLSARSRTVFKRGQLIPLTSVEFDLLTILMRLAGRIISRDEIATQLYSRTHTPLGRAIDVQISHLRKKIDADRQARIRTVQGTGYLSTLPAE